MEIDIEGYKVYYLNKKGLKEEFDKGNIQGKGTEVNPYTFNNINSIPKYLVLFRITSSFLIENGSFEKITLTYCKHIKLNNCKIDTLSLEECSKIKIIQNTIRSISIEKCGNNLFQQNVLSPNTLQKLKKKQILLPIFELFFFITMTIVLVVSMLLAIDAYLLYIYSPTFILFVFIYGILFFLWFIFLRGIVSKVRHYASIKNKPNILLSNEIREDWEAFTIG